MSNEGKIIAILAGTCLAGVGIGYGNDYVFSKLFTKKANNELSKVDATEGDYWKKYNNIHLKNTIESNACSLAATVVECKVVQNIAVKAIEKLSY